VLTIYRRHSRSGKTKCKFKSPHEKRCSCPIWVKGWLNGERFPRKALHSRTWADAEREVEKWQRDPTAVEQPEDRPGVPVVHAIAKYLIHCTTENNVAPATLTSYKKTLEHFTTFLNSRSEKSIGEITIQTARDFLATRAQYTPRTRRKELEHLRFFFWFAHDNDWIVKNPAAAKGKRGVRVKVPKGGATQPLSDEEIDALLKAAGEIDNPNKTWIPRARLRAKALILVLAYTGLRISDVVSLQRGAIKKDGSITLEILKTKQELTIVLNKQVMEDLKALPKESFYYFWSGPTESKITTATSTARRTLSRLGKKTGISVSPHRFRDTFAKKVLEATGDIRALQFALGHTSVKTTESAYVHLGEEHQKRVRETFQQVTYIRPA
jgi:site-specific recombinase XerD